MAFIREPTVDQVRRYVIKHYSPDKAETLLGILSRISTWFGDDTGWYQAAILIQWEKNASRDPQHLESYVELINRDQRDFLLEFGRGPTPSWENLFIRLPQE